MNGRTILSAGLVLVTACVMKPRHTRDGQHHGVKVVRGSDLELNTAQTAGMTRAVTINYATVGASKLWAGRVKLHPDATGVKVVAAF